MPRLIKGNYYFVQDNENYRQYIICFKTNYTYDVINKKHIDLELVIQPNFKISPIENINIIVNNTPKLIEVNVLDKLNETLDEYKQSEVILNNLKEAHLNYIEARRKLAQAKEDYNKYCK